MKIIKENNIAKVIIVSFAFILFALMLLTIYFSIDRQYGEFKKELNSLKKERINNQKIFLKREMNSVVHFINFINNDKNIDKKSAKKIIFKYINSIRFGEKLTNYVFVYKILNFNGGDRFVKMLINPNRADLIGKYISDNYKDADGKEFRKEFLKDIKAKGDSFVIYRYKKLGLNKKTLKLSYFKLYKKYNWVIAAGVYLDDIEKSIELKKQQLLTNVEKEIELTAIIYFLFFIIAFMLAMFLGNRIDRFFQNYKDKVEKQTIELENLNTNLEEKVKIEVEKNREKDQFLIQKSKFIALGEMISNIAHQWRQPLNELSSVMLNIKMRYRKKLLDEKYFETKSKDIDRLLEFMSQTIDDFRNFFIPDKTKKLFSIKRACKRVESIMQSSLKDKNIIVKMDINKI
jgi:signal transduction histidine kinase